MKLKDANIANSIFPGLNDQYGIMLCGYEWGYAKADQEADQSQSARVEFDTETKVTFANKAPKYGDSALRWPYDNEIITWFRLWGHPLDREQPGDFEKSIIQTNWCRSQGHDMDGEAKKKIKMDEHKKNFLEHIEAFKPAILFFFGSEMIKALQRQDILKGFESVMGAHGRLVTKQKEGLGTRFVISFQKFEQCDVISLPHPSGSQGIRHDYIASFKDDIGGIISAYRSKRGI
ncbi:MULTISPECIES: hypothetical protein [Halorhodospira]|uniref:hypothetical protein n=1 Tax=Halorhodospira TaxID=85108 RepID=UPI001EE7C85A|nr:MULTISPECIES: hypothetical protein [Halorhodospira]MCG5528044.1 hypothetical protein [Halorhodospira halophila]MCG5543084.1 hypothetical protein [Halorhodospira sp. 9628]